MRRTAVLLLLVLASLPLACGEGDALSPEAAVAEAATKTADAGSARVDIDAGLNSSAGSFTMTGEGEFAGDRGRMTFDVVAGGQRISMEMVFDQLIIYMRFPSGLGVDLPGDKSWVKMDLEALGKEEGIDFSQFTQFGQSDPTQTLRYLRGASGDFEKVGEEEIRDVATTHYRGTVDLRKAADQLPESARESIVRLVELVGKSTFPFDVWVDDEGLARRIKYEQPIPDANGQNATMAMTMDFYDFGAEVDVEPPADDEVVDLQKLMRQGG